MATAVQAWTNLAALFTGELRVLLLQRALVIDPDSALPFSAWAGDEYQGITQIARIDAELREGQTPTVVMDDLVLVATELCEKNTWVYDVDDLNKATAANRAYCFATSELLEAVVETLTTTEPGTYLFQASLYFLLRLSELLESVWPQDVLCARGGPPANAAVALRAFAHAVAPALPVLVKIIAALPRHRAFTSPGENAGEPADPDSVAAVYQLMAVPVLIAATRDPSNEDARRSALRADVAPAIAHALSTSSINLRIMLFDAISVLAQSKESVALFCSRSLRIMPSWLGLLDHWSLELKLAAVRALHVFFRGGAGYGVVVEYGLVQKLCSLATIADLPIELLGEVMGALSLLTNPSNDTEEAASPDDDAGVRASRTGFDDLGSLGELFQPKVLDTLAVVLQVEQAKPLVLKLLCKMCGFEAGCNAVAACEALVTELKEIILTEGDLHVLFHALRVLLSLCAVPSARAAFGVDKSWLSMLVISVDDADRKARYCQVLDVLCNDRSSLGILLRADVLSEIHRCLVELSNSGRDAVVVKGTMVTIFRNLLIPICAHTDVVSELADNDALVALLFRFLTAGLCSREVLAVFSQLACSAPGCGVLLSGDIDFLPLLLAICRENPTPKTGAPEPVDAASSHASDLDGESMYSPIRVVVSYGILCLARVCGDPEGFRAANAAESDFVGLWMKALCSHSCLVRQRAFLGVKYMLRHYDGQQFVHSTPLLDTVIRTVTSPQLAYAESSAVYNTALAALGSLCSAVTVGTTLPLLNMCVPDVLKKVKDALAVVLKSPADYGARAWLACLPCVFQVRSSVRVCWNTGALQMTTRVGWHSAFSVRCPVTLRLSATPCQ